MQALAKQQLVSESHAALLQVETLSGGVEIIEGLTSEWRALCADQAQPFVQPEWIAAYVRAFAADKTLRVFTVRRGRKLCAVLPLIDERATLHGFPVRKLRSPSNVHSCRFDLVVAPNESAAVIPALWQALRQQSDAGDWDVLELCDVPQAGWAERLLAEAAHDKFCVGQWAMPPGPYVSLMPPAESHGEKAGNPVYGSKKLRSSLRYLRRRLEQQGTVQFHCETSPQQLSRFYALESAGWKGQQGTAIACDDQTRQFYDAIVQTAVQQGRLRLYRLDFGEQTIAMQLCVTEGKNCFLLKPAYDEAFHPYSPGQLLVLEVLADLTARGFAEYDLLSPQSEWKSRWSKEVREQSHLYIFRRGVRGQALHAWKFQVLLRLRQIKQNYQGGSSNKAML